MTPRRDANISVEAFEQRISLSAFTSTVDHQNGRSEGPSAEGKGG